MYRILATLVLLTACMDRAPARLVVDSDTLIINGPRPVLVPIRAVDGDGRRVLRPALSYSSSSGAVRVSHDGRITCTHAGDAVVAVSQRAVTAQVVVRCRLIVSFSPNGSALHLWAGEPPVTPVVRAFDSAGKTVDLLHGTASIPDDSVARIVGGRVVALARGRTQLDLDFDGVAVHMPIRVDERVIGDSVHLVGGELRSWPVPPGYYELQLDLQRGNERQSGLELAAYHANCARSPLGGDQHYFCVLKDRASVIVRNVREVGPRSERSGELTVLRQP